MNFNIGDIVQLKSGGTKMTVKGILGDVNQSLTKMEETALKIRGYQDGSVFCEWFLDNKLTSNVFKPEVLKKIIDE